MPNCQIKGIGYAMRGASVTVCEDYNGKVTVLYQGESQKYSTYKRGEKPQSLADEKTINQIVEQTVKAQKARKHYKPIVVIPFVSCTMGQLQELCFSCCRLSCDDNFREG